jgi:hypothetical protein
MTASAVGAVMDDSPRASSTMARMIGPEVGGVLRRGEPGHDEAGPSAAARTPTTSREPTLSATTAAIGVKMAATMAKGSVCTPADSVE